MPLTAKELAAMGQQAGSGLGKGLGQVLVARAARQNQLDRALGQIESFRAGYENYENTDPDSVEGFQVQQALGSLSGINQDSSPSSIIEAAGLLPGFQKNISAGQLSDFEAINKARGVAVGEVEEILEQGRQGRLEKSELARRDFLAANPSASSLFGGGGSSGGAGGGSISSASTTTGRAKKFSGNMSGPIVGEITGGLDTRNKSIGVLASPLSMALLGGSHSRLESVDRTLKRFNYTDRAHPLLGDLDEVLSPEVMSHSGVDKPGWTSRSELIQGNLEGIRLRSIERLEETRDQEEAKANLHGRSTKGRLAQEAVEELDKAIARFEPESDEWQAVVEYYEGMIPAYREHLKGANVYRASLADEAAEWASGGTTDPGAGSGRSRQSRVLEHSKETAATLAGFAPEPRDLQEATIATATPAELASAMKMVGTRYRASGNARGLAALQRMAPRSSAAAPPRPPAPVAEEEEGGVGEWGEAPPVESLNRRLPDEMPLPWRPPGAEPQEPTYYTGDFTPDDDPNPPLEEIADRLVSEAGSFEPIVSNRWLDRHRRRQMEYLRTRGLFDRLRAENEKMYNPMLARRFTD